MIAQTALEWYNDKPRQKRISFGCQVLDKLTGGISSYGITEISGIAGSGKTQICLTLCLQCALSIQLERSHDNVAYICCGEGMFPLKRFVELSEHYELVARCTSTESKLTKESLLQCVQIQMCRTMEDVFEAIDKAIPNIIQNKNNIRLVVIDSLAGIVRTDYDTRTSQDMLKRTAMLFRFSAKLKWLADTYRLAIVVVNQVTSTGFEDSNSFRFTGQSRRSCNVVVPALGLAWTHCINTRIMLHRDTSSLRSALPSFTDADADNALKQQQLSPDEPLIRHSTCDHDPSTHNENINRVRNINTSDTSRTDDALSDKQVARRNPRGTLVAQSQRKMEIIFSPTHPRSTCDYIITSEGVFGI